jgi:hypothetical protein
VRGVFQPLLRIGFLHLGRLNHRTVDTLYSGHFELSSALHDNKSFTALPGNENS